MNLVWVAATDMAQAAAQKPHGPGRPTIKLVCLPLTQDSQQQSQLLPGPARTSAVLEGCTAGGPKGEIFLQGASIAPVTVQLPAEQSDRAADSFQNRPHPVP